MFFFWARHASSILLHHNNIIEVHLACLFVQDLEVGFDKAIELLDLASQRCTILLQALGGLILAGFQDPNLIRLTRTPDK